MDCGFGIRMTDRVSELSRLQGLIDATFCHLLYHIRYLKKCDLSFHSMARVELFQKMGKGRWNGGGAEMQGRGYEHRFGCQSCGPALGSMGS